MPKARSNDFASSSSQHTTRYATTKRKGRFLQLKVRQVRHAIEIHERKEDFKSIASSVSSVAKKMPDFLREMQIANPVSAPIPSCDIDMATLRFVDETLEEEYRVYATKNFIAPAIYTLLINFVYSSFTGFNVLFWGQMFSAYVYFLIAFVSLSFLLCFIKLKMDIKHPKNEVSCSKFYYELHKIIYITLSILFYAKNANHPDNIIIQIKFVILVMTVMLPGEYRAQIFATMVSVLCPLISLGVLTAWTFEIIFRCVSPLVVTSFFAIVLLRVVEVQRKHAFYSIKKLAWIEKQAENTRNQTKFLLANMYPIPVANAIIETSSITPSFESKICFVMCVLINPKNPTPESIKSSLKDIGKYYGHRLHKIQSAGLCITFCTGLFGETIVNIVKSARNMIQKCRAMQESDTVIIIGIGSGWTQGGMIMSSKTSFDIFGSAYEEALHSLSLGKDWQIVVDGNSKDIWENDFAREAELHDFKLISCANEEHKTHWIFNYGLDIRQENHEASPNAINRKTEKMKKGKLLAFNLMDESKEDPTDPYVSGKKNRGIMGYLGDMRFKDSWEENEFQESLKTKNNRDVNAFQAWAMFIFFTLFGYIDYSILKYECQEFDISVNSLFMARYLILSPLLIYFALSQTITESVPNFNGLRIDGWNVPLFIGTTCGVFSLMRLLFIYGNLGMVCIIALNHNPFLYSEIYEVSIFYLSSINVAPIRIIQQTLVWMVISMYIFAAHHTHMSYTLAAIPMAAINWILIPQLIFHVLLFSRDVNLRREYISRKNMKKGIEILLEENELNEKALLSSLSTDMLRDLKANRFSSFQSLNDGVIVFIEIKYPLEFKNCSADLNFRIISNVILKIEEIANTFGIEAIKSTSNHIMVLSKPKIMEEIFEKDTQYIEKALAFGLEVQSMMECMRILDSSKIECRICINKGLITYGLFGNHEFVYDCFGDAISEAFWMSKKLRFGDVVVTETVYNETNLMTTIDFQNIGVIGISHARPTNAYRLLSKTDVWGMYSRYIAWLDDDLR